MWRDIFSTITELIVASPNVWKTIEREKKSHHEFLTRYLHPLFGIIAIASFIGGLWVIRDGSIERGLKQAIINVVSVYGGYFIASYSLNELASDFGLKRHLPTFQKFVGYSSSILYLLFIIIPFFPSFIILWLLALYTIYPVHIGSHYFLKVADDKRLNFTLISSALILLIPAVIRLLFSVTIN